MAGRTKRKEKEKVVFVGVKEAGSSDTRRSGKRSTWYKVVVSDDPALSASVESQMPVVSAEEFERRMRIPLTYQESEKSERKPTQIIGNICLINYDRKERRYSVESRGLVQGFDLKDADGKPYRANGIRELVESEEFRRTLALEVFPNSDVFGTNTEFTDVIQRGVVTPPNDEYIVLLGGPFSKQQYLYDYLEMHAKCFEAKNHNPLAKAIVDIKRNYVMGKGARVSFRDERWQDAWDEFEKENSLQAVWQSDYETLTWAGEIMGWKKNERRDGSRFGIRFDQIDPSTVWEIVTPPEDITNPLIYHQQFPTQYQILYGNDPKVETSKYVINDIPADEVIHIKINAAVGEKRGRSDLMPVLGWLKRWKDYYNAKITKAQIEQSFAMLKKIKGADTDVSSFANNQDFNRVPPPGSIIFENESITTSYLESKSSGSGQDDLGEQIKAIIATGCNLSPDHLGVQTRGGARSTSLTKAEPAAKAFERGQLVMEGYIRQVVDWFVERELGKSLPKVQDRKAGFDGLKKAFKRRDIKSIIKEASLMLVSGTITEPVDDYYEVIFPEILTEDRTNKIKDIVTAFTVKAMAHDRMSNMIVKELNVTSYDYDEEQEKIAEKQKDPVLQALYKMPTDIGKPAPGKPDGSEPGNTGNSGAEKERFKRDEKR